MRYLLLGIATVSACSGANPEYVPEMNHPPTVDLARTDDASTPVDLSAPDLRSPPDLAAVEDLATPPDLELPDLAMPPDLTPEPDLTESLDFSVAPDLAAVDDLTFLPDLTTPDLRPDCLPGFANCDGNDANGCEVNLLRDVNNCGGCGGVCSAVAHGTPACSGSLCVIGSCSPPFQDCNRNPGDGCETNITSNVNNCGSCGNACPAVAHGSAGCVTSNCVISSCNMPFRDCNGLYGDGCEVNASTSVSNCGGCGHACLNGTSCFGGICQ